MKRKKYKDWLWIISVSVFVICTVQGIFWYRLISPVSDNFFIRILCYLQNGIKAFKLDPDIKLKDVANVLPSIESGWLRLFLYLYCVAVITAPFCTVAALTILIKKPVYYFKGLKNRIKRKKILLIGNGETKKRFALSLPGDECRVFSVENTLLSDETKLTYLKKGIRHFTDYEDRDEKQLYRQAELMSTDIVILCDDDVIKNLVALKKITGFYLENPVTRADELPRQDIYVICEDEGMKEVISLYFDEYMKKVRNRKGIRSFDLYVMDPKEKAVRKMFDEKPLFTANKEKDDDDETALDVHLGILGFGDYGQKTLLQALNLAVFSKESTILVDVFDKEIDREFQSFLRHFSTEMLNRVETDVRDGAETVNYQIRLPSEDSRVFGMDGHVTIRFWGCDSEKLDFRKKILHTAKQMPYTYFVVAMSKDKEITVSIKEICKMIYHDNKDRHVPVVVRTKEVGPIAELFTDGYVSTINEQEDVYSLKALIDDSLVQRAKQFNFRYNQVSGGLEDRQPAEAEMNEAWSRMSAFKRESSLAQAMHQEAKKWLVQRGLSDKEEREALEHRRWCLFMILNGYCYGPVRDDVYKTHDCISTFDDLKKERPDTLEYDNTPYILLEREERNRV